MKPLKEVEQERKEYHAKPMQNTVHRSSLLVPHIPGTKTEISFINHFLMKRNNRDVTCKLTVLNESGQRVHSESFPVDGMKVFRVPLSEMFPANFHSCIVEFYSGSNLFIPFPAVMVNHVGPGFVNFVHAYNRVLNDIFEDDAINSKHNKEAFIDVRVDEDFDTFILFTAGADGCDEPLTVELTDGKRSFAKTVPMQAKRLSHHWLSLKKLFPEFRTAPGKGAILKVQQPRQSLFYGRVFAGRVHRDGSFSANHSYYDCLDNPEYWDDSSDSYRAYPYIPGFENGVRLYPVSAPGKLRVTFKLHDTAGKIMPAAQAFELVSPGAEFLDISIDELARKSGMKVSDLSAFTVIASPVDGKAPTRIGCQLIYTRGQLDASINAQLGNGNHFMPPRKKSIVWGQTVIGANLESWLGITSSEALHDSTELTLTFYTTEGELTKKTYPLPHGCALRLNIAEELKPDLRGLDLREATYVWYSFEAERPDMAGYTVVADKKTRHCSGEHSF